MVHQQFSTAFIGFGEAAMAFAEEGGWDDLRAFDIKTNDPVAAGAKLKDYARCGVVGSATLAAAIGDADLLISLVTADQASAAAAAAANALKPGALYCDFNSVAPATKQAAEKVIQCAGGRYVDVAVMESVRPARLSVPLLVSGAHAEEACAALASIGFKPRRVDGPVGKASMIKMLRSIMVKGIEALTAECFLAAHRAGVLDEVRNSLDASWPGIDWAAKADYNLERMMIHGLRRAAEMEAAAETLASLGNGNEMTQAAAQKQRSIGMIGRAAPRGLAAKSELILGPRARAA